MKIAFSAMMNPTQGLALSRQSGTKVDAILGNAAQTARGDRVSLSQTGRKAAESSADGFLKNLIDRKSYLQDRRKELLTSAARDPSQKESIRYKIKEIDKQLGEINQQMSDYLLQKQQEALEKKEEKKNEELTPEQAREKQLQNVAEAKEKLERSDELGVTRAILNRSKAHAEEWGENSSSLSALGTETQRASYASTVDKLEKGIQGLEHSQRALVADAQKLAEEAASLRGQAPSPEEEQEKGMLSSLEKALENSQQEQTDEDREEKTASGPAEG
ncbi:MAG: hypothetical protein HFG27_11480 [Provencibacterium sp.]|nr:hypothetical protein [Provencibacterium sp.]